MTQRGLSEILTLLEASYGMKLDRTRARAWLLLLEPIGDEEGKAAAIRLCRESVYPPKPADIFRLVGEARERRRYAPLALPEPADPEVAQRGLAMIREAIAQIGKPIPQ